MQLKSNTIIYHENKKKSYKQNLKLTFCFAKIYNPRDRLILLLNVYFCEELRT
jgi:hypothetical protein